MEVTVCTGTFGDSKWGELANERARPSVPDGVPWIHVHAETLAQARNMALERVETEFVIHLDADDELEPGYIEAMATGGADVRGPVARYVQDGRGRLWQPRVAGHRHDCVATCLPEGNWLIVGAAARTELVREAGGWRDFPWSEDWSTWLRCYKIGASFELIPEAVYRAHVRWDSRNRGVSHAEKMAAHEAIYRDAYPEEATV